MLIAECYLLFDSGWLTCPGLNRTTLIVPVGRVRRRTHRRRVDGLRSLDAVLKTSQQHLFLFAARDSCSLNIVVVPLDASFEGGGSRGRSAIR
jgi:hypothetical protein